MSERAIRVQVNVLYRLSVQADRITKDPPSGTAGDRHDFDDTLDIPSSGAFRRFARDLR